MTPAENQARISKEVEQCQARLTWLEQHHGEHGKEAALLKRRLVMLGAIQAATKK